MRKFYCMREKEVSSFCRKIEGALKFRDCLDIRTRLTDSKLSYTVEVSP